MTAVPTILVPVAKVSFTHCARCGQAHADLNVFLFGRPVELRGELIASHWALCIETGEPILVRFEPREAFARPDGEKA